MDGPERQRRRPAEQEVGVEHGDWPVLVLLSEVHQWFDCNIQKPENMEAGFGKKSPENSSSEYGKC